MAEYIKKDDVLKRFGRNSITKSITFADGVSIYDTLQNFPAADVVPRAEVEQLQKENEALTVNMNAFGLAAKRLKEEKDALAREIFEEIYEDCFDQFGYIDYEALAELKNKYIGDQNDGKRA